MHYITAYTPKYYQYLKPLQLSCSEPLIAYPYADQGSWMRNMQYKVTVIHHALNHLKDDILWVDVDTIFKQPASLPDYGDVALSIWQPHSPYIYDFDLRVVRKNTEQTPTGGGGVILLRYNTKVLHMAETWLQLQKEHDTTDEQTLREALRLHPECEVVNFDDKAFGFLYAGYKGNGKPIRGGVVCS